MNVRAGRSNTTPRDSALAGTEEGRATSEEWMGRVLVVALFITLLAGDFAVGGIEVRWLALSSLVVGVIAWRTVERSAIVGRRGLLPLVMLVTTLVYLAITSQWTPPGIATAPAMADLVVLCLMMVLTFSISSHLSSTALNCLWPWVFWISIVYWLVGALTTSDVQGRWSVPGGGPNVFVRVMGLGILAALFLWTQSRRPAAAALGIPILVVGALFSGSRGGVLSIIIMLVAYVLLRRPLSTKARRRSLIVIIGGGAIALLVIGRESRARLQQRFIESVFDEHYTSGRGQITAEAIDMFNAHFLRGNGIESVKAAAGNYAHNLFVSIGAEGGLVGLALICATLASFALAIGRLRTLDPSTVYFMLGGTFILLASMFSGYYYDTRFAWFFLLLACAAKDSWRPCAAVRPYAAIAASTS